MQRTRRQRFNSLLLQSECPFYRTGGGISRPTLKVVFVSSALTLWTGGWKYTAMVRMSIISTWHAHLERQIVHLKFVHLSTFLRNLRQEGRQKKWMVKNRYWDLMWTLGEFHFVTRMKNRVIFEITYAGRANHWLSSSTKNWRRLPFPQKVRLSWFAYRIHVAEGFVHQKRRR